MPHRTVQQSSNLPSLLMACAGISLAVPLIHDAIHQRIFTSESIFDSRASALLAVLGIGMAGILLWDFFASRRSR
jgi:hypothetical protein